VGDYAIPDDRRYTREDEWVRAEGAQMRVGVTDYAQQQLGDVVFVELPKVGSQVTQGKAFGVIESVKAVSDLFAPVSGRVAAVNDSLSDRPEQVNEACYDAGWIVLIDGASPAQVSGLMSASEYRAYLQTRDA
jgi:glycine cleavage system H protein